MSDDFLNEVVQTTREAMKKILPFGPQCPQLPDQNTHLYGREAGEDYAQTVFETIKAAVLYNAKYQRKTADIKVPSGGNSARNSMQIALGKMLPGFDVSVTGDRLLVDWQRHCLGF
jgi:hypothetical protein